ncbi:DUF7674 family protein [Paenibacillus planticolens]|uniref:DUF7674 domain-containing protein n=1 Tax=Paenibacillus planticolens TaxID=2654976 RepID=A0ABX1ZN00_9BACL|nr:hypothetical protein [Paenibacillus planticolens]NOV01196.1 hypothetical protein [Paenibacillus planticolens]
MIQKEQVMDMIIKACLSYKNRYSIYLKDNYEVGEERLLYVDITDFIDHMFERYQKRCIEELDKVFDCIEELHLNGDDYVKEWATIGFLEIFRTNYYERILSLMNLIFI